MKIAILTSSRADFGIYLPLLKKLKKDKFFDIEIVAFGTHLWKPNGATAKEFEQHGFTEYNTKIHKVFTQGRSNHPWEIAGSMGHAIQCFSSFWKENNNYDLILSLGDRYEMFAAVTASVPFNIPVSHIHGGETTLGAIDNKFRHSITSMSSLHFTSHPEHSKRVEQITGSKKDIHTVGALALDNLKELKLLTVNNIKKKYNIDLSIPTILFTFHPETIEYEKNEQHITEIIEAFKKINYQLAITMPNADTHNQVIRDKLNEFIEKNDNAYGFESLGVQNYFSFMKHCAFVMGNSSSGIIEAASFHKGTLNLGNRQKGRLIGYNVFHCEIEKRQIIDAIHDESAFPVYIRENIYWQGGAADKIIKSLKQWTTRHF